ncbi:DUF1501 domain-containing protein [Dokdonella sp. MW10]|uniref:DUF1501 domain-containing protein n=1 Tax=Dokdonella sp. MW10 TaxID=2992926 RepID=UPI003F7FF2E4
MTTFDRRDFLKTCAVGSLTAGIVPGARVAFAQPEVNTYDTLVLVFLRGGIDGLSLVPPISGNDRNYYEAARPTLRVPVSGTGAALALANSASANATSGLHPRASRLHTLYQQNKLAVVIGAGMPAPVTRSHFDAQQTMEYGTPGSTSISSGWLTRHLASAGLPANVTIPAVSAGSITANSLIASTESITMGSGGDFRIDQSAWNWNSRDRYDTPPNGFQGLVERLPELWAGNNPLEAAGRQTLDALSIVRPMNFGAYNATSNPGGYAPANGAAYPTDGLGNQLKMIAQLIKANVGMRVAALDYGGWDTHNGQGVPTASYDPFGNSVEALSNALAAFYQDLNGTGANAFANRTSIVVMSEFGRRLRANGSGGTDHGYGNMMMVLGGSVNGGQVYGRQTFAGLAGEALFEGEDVRVTTDFRRVLSEALIRRAGNNRLGYIFPAYSGYSPLGIFQGTDMTPDYTNSFDRIFRGTFEAA